MSQHSQKTDGPIQLWRGIQETGNYHLGVLLNDEKMKLKKKGKGKNEIEMHCGQ